MSKPRQGQAGPELLALGRAIRRRREAKGWTLDTLAAESGVSRRMLIGIEHGSRNAGVVSVFAIASALGANPAELIAEAVVDGDG
jgi:transcriptional regulator with XRE-family HTH domain